MRYYNFFNRLKNRLVQNTRLEDGCHIWKGQIFHGGPVIKVRGTYLSVRRVMYALKHKVPYDSFGVIKGLCGRADCVNPDHSTVTNREKQESKHAPKL